MNRKEVINLIERYTKAINDSNPSEINECINQITTAVIEQYGCADCAIINKCMELIRNAATIGIPEISDGLSEHDVNEALIHKQNIIDELVDLICDEELVGIQRLPDTAAMDFHLNYDIGLLD